MHYLNNFWSIHLNRSADKAHIKEFDLICSNVGFNMKTKKDKIGTIIDFLDIELDTMAIEACFSPKKL